MLLALPIIVSAQYREYDWEERDEWMNLDSILEVIGVAEGQSIADIGCHEGYLSVHLSKWVGEEGKVYAVDVRKDRLETLDQTLESRTIQNVETIHGDYDNPRLPKNALDIVFIMDTYHEMTDYMEILEHVNNSLKSNGKIVLIEKLKRRIKGKSRTQQVGAHSLSPKYVKKELIKAGFKIIHQDNDLGDWENDEDKTIWMLVGKKPLN